MVTSHMCKNRLWHQQLSHQETMPDVSNLQPGFEQLLQDTDVWNLYNKACADAGSSEGAAHVCQASANRDCVAYTATHTWQTWELI